MTSVNKLLEYHELLMNYEDTSNYENYDLLLEKKKEYEME